VNATLLVTGGCGFIGSNFVLDWVRGGHGRVVNLDLLTYAGNLSNLDAIAGSPAHRFVHGDIGDAALVGELLDTERPAAIVHFAAESHVDRSIHDAAAFIDTNVTGTWRLLEAARRYWSALAPGERETFRFVHVSTDEVYGSLGPGDPPFTEATPYAPTSPYAASKAAADHLARAWSHTWGLPVIVTNCSNNYGPLQFPEKLIALMIRNALRGLPLPVYGDGGQVRDWLHVADHCAALRRVLEAGRPGQTYNIGGNSERRNLDVVHALCAALDAALPDSPHRPHANLIRFVTDRPGHDRRYAIDCGKIGRELGWQPVRRFEEGLAATVRWYLEHPDWVARVESGEYRRWIETQYGARVARAQPA
jgi:dTDP-glucose 4,6-dehydratase